MQRTSATPSKVKKRRKKPSEFNVKKFFGKKDQPGLGLAEEAKLREKECCLTNPNFAIISSFLQQEWNSSQLLVAFKRISVLTGRYGTGM